jgi:hypothetical protein
MAGFLYRWYKIFIKCPAKNNKSTCDNSGKCCSTALLQSQPDFQNQKGWLQEEIEAAGHNVIFYPEFHCELFLLNDFGVLLNIILGKIAAIQ